MNLADEKLLDKTAWILPIIVATLVVAQLLPIHGQLGHDYYHFYARLYIGAVHFWQNGLAVPHYTPSLCGGVPFFADPQSVYYSLPQFLTFFIDPLPATMLSVAVFYLIGYAGFHRLARTAFGFHPVASHLGALLFVVNGFSFAHLFVGHATHHTFLLYGWVLYYLFRGRGVRDAAILSLIITYTLYSGGMHMLVVFAVGTLIALPFLLEYREIRAFLPFVGLCLLFVTLCCAGKLAASALYSRNFYHGGIDSSGVGVFSLVTRYFWFDPQATPLFIQFGRLAFGPWEYVGFLSKAVIPACVLFPLLLLKSHGPRRFGLLTVYSLVILLVCVVASGNKFNRSVPFFRDYHNPLKILSALVPFLLLAFTYCADWIVAKMPSPSSPRLGRFLYFIVAMLFVGEFQGYANYFTSNRIALGYSYSPNVYRDLKAIGRLPPVTEAIPHVGADDRAVALGRTSLRCYEPVFGYRGENLHVDVRTGPTATIRDGRFNLTHPGCLLYPSYFGCRAWDRIPAADRASFTGFARGEQEWGVPAWQNALLAVGFASILMLLIVAVDPGRFRISRPLEVPRAQPARKVR